MQQKKDFAIASFIAGLFIWIPFLNVFVVGPLAILLGVMALLDIRKNPEMFGGTAFAVIGIILGAIPIFFSVIGWIIGIN